MLVPSLTDKQLTDLGVTAIGDKAMLRAAGFCHPQYIECKYYSYIINQKNNILLHVFYLI